MKPQKRTSTNRLTRTSQRIKKEPDNDGDIFVPEEVQKVIDASRHFEASNTLGENVAEAEEELNLQAQEKIEKAERKKQKELEEAIIFSTQKQSEAIQKTFQEIMDGVEEPQGGKK
jgi:hypothetical protein